MAGATRVGRGLVLLALGASSCLVTEPIEYDEQNVPPMLTVLTPAATFARLPPTADPVCTTVFDSDSDKDFMRFEVRVQDANVTDDLEGRVLVNGMPSFSAETIPFTGRMDRGAVQLCVDRDTMNQPCNRVEYFVSRGFSGLGGYQQPKDPDDVAKVEWWVLGDADQWPQALASDCEEYFREGELP